ncbi:hypothetical protein J2Z53_000664 [Clostridium moniliforme]|uniref:Uncharacterized protein n=1 Tax=Clostridium moniliforme TaxID=39489 RepID=A0ABS4EYL5_9CLOT|nr:hypothetical protein [Clostridium moniliforme]MBP1889085.1 hypothetical protein [Clostridium moniliforme]
MNKKSINKIIAKGLVCTAIVGTGVAVNTGLANAAEPSAKQIAEKEMIPSREAEDNMIKD